MSLSITSPAPTWQLLQKKYADGANPYIEITNIPANKKLKFFVEIKNSTTTWLKLQFNNDATASFHRYNYIYAAGGVISSATVDSEFVLISSLGNLRINLSELLVYNTVGIQKAFYMWGGIRSSTRIATGQYQETAAITSAKFYTLDGNILDTESNITMLGMNQ